MSRAYQGYTQANQSPVMEENESETAEEQDVEAGYAQPRTRTSSFSVKAQGKRKISWGTSDEVSEMNPLRPNIRSEDKLYEQDMSDDEVPQSFMIEASRSSRRPSPSSARDANKGKVRSQPLHSSSARALARENQPALPVFTPPRPSELDVDAPQPPPSQPNSSRPFRGLDAYERALWNWVNIYNLDAFLQEVYQYYEGKGIYSIALARGLNILSAHVDNITYLD